MPARAAVAPRLLARARADQVAILYGSWHRTTVSMALGALILCTVLWDQESATAMAVWFAAIVANQAWRGALARAYRRRAPAVEDALRWGNYWATGATLAGALWGLAAVAMFPASPPHQALLIVCLFSVILGGLNLTAVYKPSFYGFALAALIPLIARVAWEGDQVHLFTAMVLFVVLVFVLGFGRQVNDLLTNALASRYENVDLIDELTAQTKAAETARNAAETANRAKSQFLAAASHDLRQPLHAMGLFAAALAARARDPETKPLVASIHASVEALEGLFAQLLDLSRLEAGALRPEQAPVALDPLFARLLADFAPQAAAHGLALRVVPTSCCVGSDPVLLERILRNLLANALRYTRSGGVLLGARRQGHAVRIDILDSGVGIAPADRERIFEEFVQLGSAPRHADGRGMGLGLAIVRRLCLLLGHRLDLGSTPGRGSRFSVTAPRTGIRGKHRGARVPHRPRARGPHHRRRRSRIAACSSSTTTRRSVNAVPSVMRSTGAGPVRDPGAPRCFPRMPVRGTVTEKREPRPGARRARADGRAAAEPAHDREAEAHAAAGGMARCAARCTNSSKIRSRFGRDADAAVDDVDAHGVPRRRAPTTTPPARV